MNTSRQKSRRITEKSGTNLYKFEVEPDCRNTFSSNSRKESIKCFTFEVKNQDKIDIVRKNRCKSRD